MGMSSRLTTQPSSTPQNLTDAIARAAADTLQGPMQAAYRKPSRAWSCPAEKRAARPCSSRSMTASDWAHRSVSGVFCLREGEANFFSPLFLSWPPWSLFRLAAVENHMKSRKARESRRHGSLCWPSCGLVSTLQGATEQMAATVSGSVRLRCSTSCTWP